MGSAALRSGILTLLDRDIEKALGFDDVLIERVMIAIRSLPESVITTKSLRHRVMKCGSGETMCQSRQFVVEE